DVQEVALDLLAALLRNLLGEIVGDGLGDHGLATAGRSVEQHALRRREMMLLVVLGVEVRELDGVLDRLDLRAEPADVLIADVGDFLQRQVLDLTPGEPLEEVAGLRIHQEMVTDLQACRAQRIGDDADLVFVRAQRDDHALVVELLFEDHDLALDIEAGDVDDVQAFVQDQLLTRPQRRDDDRRMGVDLRLASLGEHIHGAVVIRGQIDGIGRRRRRQLVDLIPERADVLTGFGERLPQLLVLSPGVRQLQGAGVFGRVALRFGRAVGVHSILEFFDRYAARASATAGSLRRSRLSAAFAGMTHASPVKTGSPRLFTHSVRRHTRFLPWMISATSTRAVMVSFSFTGRRNLRVWER